MAPVGRCKEELAAAIESLAPEPGADRCAAAVQGPLRCCRRPWACCAAAAGWLALRCRRCRLVVAVVPPLPAGCGRGAAAPPPLLACASSPGVASGAKWLPGCPRCCPVSPGRLRRGGQSRRSNAPAPAAARPLRLVSAPALLSSTTPPCTHPPTLPTFPPTMQVGRGQQAQQQQRPLAASAARPRAHHEPRRRAQAHRQVSERCQAPAQRRVGESPAVTRGGSCLPVFWACTIS
jgi:hypothetical protein